MEVVRFWLLKYLITFRWWCESFLENTPHYKQHKPIFFTGLEPFLIGLAVSLATSAVTYGITRLLTPRPKQQVNKLHDKEILFTDSAFGVLMIEVFGATPPDGSPAGVEVGSNIIWASEIRVIRTQVPASSSGGGGKGAPKPPPAVQLNYKIDCAAAAGRGPLRLLRMKFDQDTVFNQMPVYNTNPTFEIEAESPLNTRSGGALIAADADCSNGQKVTGIGTGGVLIFNSVGAEADPPWTEFPIEDFPPETRAFIRMDIYYKSPVPRLCFVKVDGAGGIVAFDATAPGTVGVKTITRDYTTASEIEFSNPDALAPEIDKIAYSIIYLTRPVITGIENPDFPSENPRDIMFLASPLESDTNPRERYNGAPTVETESGVFSATLIGGAEMTWYPGTDDQPVDPVIAAALGADSTPAFRETAYCRIKNLDFTKYGRFPQIRMLVENMELRTVSEICLDLAQRAGLEASDVDFSAAGSKRIRGYYKNGFIAPTRIFEDLALIHNLSFTETSDGRIIACDLSDRTPVATLTEADLGAFIAEENEDKIPDNISSKIPDPSVSEVHSLELRFNNPLAPSDYNADQESYVYPYTPSVRAEAKQVNATLLPHEAQRIIQLEMQKHHLKSVPHAFNVTHKFAFLNASDCIEVPIDGELHTLRIEEKTGSAPGIYEISATSEQIFVLSNENPRFIFPPQAAPDPPANTVGTLMDLPNLSDLEGLTGGVYAAGCSRDELSGAWAGAGVYRKRGTSDYELMTNLTKPALIGVAVGILGDTPEGWEAGEEDTVNSLTVDFFGSETPTTLTVEQIADGLGDWCAGSEIIGIRTWTRDTDFPNRWTGTNLSRRRKNSTAATASGHASGERVVLLSDAVKYIALDESERTIEREWKFVTFGQRLEDAAPVSFTWTGTNRENLVPVIFQYQAAINTRIFIRVGNYSIQSRFRQIQWSLSPDFSSPTSFVQGTNNEPNAQLDPEFSIVRATNLENAETRYIRVRHSSDNVNYGEWSNTVTATYPDADGTGGSGEDPAPPTGGSGPGEPPCFAGGTLFNFYDGRRLTFRTVFRRQLVGELALSFDENGRRVPGRIKKLFRSVSRRWLYVEFADGERFEVKPGHKFKTEAGEYIAIRDIPVGARVRNADGSFTALTLKQERRGRKTFYNAHVERYLNYAVGESAKDVHNLKDIVF